MTHPVEPAPHRSLWEREPVRVAAAVFLVLNGVNALLMALNAYSLDIAAAITAFVAVLQTAVSSLTVRNEVVPLKPLHDLADAA